MLQKLKQYFSTHPNDTASNSEHELRLAMAALLIEVAQSDYHDAPEEQAAILNTVQNAFELSPAESNNIIADARQQLAESVDNFQFTNLINQHYSAVQRIEFIEQLWQIAFADGHLDKYEEHLIRRIADLIYVPHSDFIKTKLSTQKQQQA